MREIMKRTVAAVMAVLIACAAAGCSSTGNSSSGSSSAGETTTTTAPVVEDMGNIDLSDVTTEYKRQSMTFLRISATSPRRKKELFREVRQCLIRIFWVSFLAMASFP